MDVIGRIVGALVLVAAIPTHRAAAQEMRFFYPAPPASAVTASKDITYSESPVLQMDVYRPAGQSAATPTIMFWNAASGAQRGNAFYRSWGEIAASKGLVAILQSFTSRERRGDDSLGAEFFAHAID